MTTPLAVENPAIRRQTRMGDMVARWVVTLFAASILLVTVLLVYQLWATSAPSRHKSGFGFLFSSEWNPVTEEFGALPFIYGTVVFFDVAALTEVPPLSLHAAVPI